MELNSIPKLIFTFLSCCSLAMNIVIVLQVNLVANSCRMPWMTKIDYLQVIIVIKLGALYFLSTKYKRETSRIRFPL